MMKILAIGASNSTQSINKTLAIYTANLVKEHVYNAQIDVLDLNDYEMPIYSPEREKASGIPQLAQDFYAKIGEADAVVISYAEYNGSYTSAWKNIFDWTSRHNMKVFQDKPMLALATSPGERGGMAVLEHAKTVASFFGADIKGSLSVPSFYEHFDSEKGELSDVELAQALKVEVAKLVALF